MKCLVPVSYIGLSNDEISILDNILSEYIFPNMGYDDGFMAIARGLNNNGIINIVYTVSTGVCITKVDQAKDIKKSAHVGDEELG